jgi:hypothetical protein
VLGNRRCHFKNTWWQTNRRRSFSLIHFNRVLEVTRTLGVTLASLMEWYSWSSPWPSQVFITICRSSGDYSLLSGILGVSPAGHVSDLFNEIHHGDVGWSLLSAAKPWS